MTNPKKCKTQVIKISEFSCVYFMIFLAVLVGFFQKRGVNRIRLKVCDLASFNLVYFSSLEYKQFIFAQKLPVIV